MFVRLDDGPRPFDDILQAQRTGMVQQQQGFENALAAEQFKVRKDQGQQELDIAEQRTNVLRRDVAGRTVSRAMKAAESFGQRIAPSRQAFESMVEDLKKSNPGGLAQTLEPYADTEFADDMLTTPEGAAAYESVSGLWLAAEGEKAGQVANSAMMGAQALMADARAGLSDKDLEPLVQMIGEGTATAPQIQAQWQALRSKAAKNIGTAEMKRVVLAEAEGAWAQAMAANRASSSKALPGEATEADTLAELRGAIETASTPEELYKARGQYLVKAYQLDGVISEAEDAAFAAGRAAAESMFQQAFGGAMGGAQQGGPRSAVQSPAGQQSAAMDPARHPNLSRAVNNVAGEDPTIARHRKVAEENGYTSAPAPGSKEAADLSRLLDEDDARYAKSMPLALESVANGDDPAAVAKARGVDVADLQEVAEQKAGNVRFRKLVEGAWNGVTKAIAGATSDAAKRSAVVKAGIAKTREEAGRLVQAIDAPLTPEEEEKLAKYAHWSSNAGDVAEWTGIPFQKVRPHLKNIRDAAEAKDQGDIGARAMKGREDARQARVAAGFKDRDALVQAIAETMIETADGAFETARAVFREEYGFEPDRSELLEARKLRARLTKERTNPPDKPKSIVSGTPVPKP